jgi:hypothetical protein
MLHIHPAQAWARMKRGQSLKQIAAETHDDPAELDRAVWDYLAREARARRVLPGIPVDLALDHHERQTAGRAA